MTVRNLKKKLQKQFEMKTVKYTPFSNGTEYAQWFEANCAQCPKYENESTERNKAGCKYVFDVELTQGVETIPLETLDFFGFKEYNILGDCPEFHLGRKHSYSDYLSAKKKADKKKKTELPLEF